jgi:hypothetical protein
LGLLLDARLEFLFRKVEALASKRGVNEADDPLMTVEMTAREVWMAFDMG